MFKVGDIVSRNKYNNDIIFKIVKIENDKVILSGVDLRLYADANINDLRKSTISKKKEVIDLNRKLDTNNYFYIPGSIIHIDSDKDYLDKCLDYYKSEKIKYYSYLLNEKDYPNKVIDIINKHTLADIIVITGHDAYYKKDNKYKNSKYYIEAVKNIRKINRNIIIISGACQSDFKNLIKCGSTYASSPSHINIHALDPAIIASYIAKTDKYESIDLNIILSKTKYGPDGIGGLKTNGVMISGAPRKDLI